MSNPICRTLIRGMALAISLLNLETVWAQPWLNRPKTVESQPFRHECPEISGSKLDQADAIVDLMIELPGYRAAISPSMVEWLVAGTMKQLGANNPAWSSSHPKWKEFKNIIQADLTRISRTVTETRNRERRLIARCFIAKGLDSEELTLIDNYLRSSAGKRHLQLGTDLEDIFDRLHSFDRLQKEGAFDRPNSADPLKNVNPAIWALVQSSLQVGLIHRVDEAMRRKTGMPAVVAQWEAVLLLNAERHGEMYGSLLPKYVADIGTFNAFVQSTAMVKYGEAVTEMLRSDVFKSAAAKSEKLRNEEFVKANKAWARLYQESVSSP
jgi:hypothetical protein